MNNGEVTASSNVTLEENIAVNTINKNGINAPDITTQIINATAVNMVVNAT